MSVVAQAHPNIALIKYWGKAAQPGNVPATPSLSITLSTLTTTTEVEESAADQFFLNGQPVQDTKVSTCLENLRRHFDVPPLTVRSGNDFPTAAGLASSASGFAALITAVDAACGLGLDPARRSDLARQASASAARSIFGGFVTLEGPEWQARELLDERSWPLEVVIAVSDTRRKVVSSTDGMRRSAGAAYFPAWVDSTHGDFDAARQVVAERDFTLLADLAEHSCLKMHALMMATPPGLLYWNATTIACVHRVRELRADGVDVFFTVDAGPQVKAVCLPESGDRVAAELEQVAGVTQVLRTGLGEGARVAA